MTRGPDPELDRLELGDQAAEQSGFENATWPLYRLAHLEFVAAKGGQR